MSRVKNTVFNGDSTKKKTHSLVTSGRDEVEGWVITDIRQAVKNQNRVNIFVNNKYAFSLDIAQVVDLKIKIGREVTAEELAEYKKASEYGKAYQRALEWVLVRPRSRRELEEYLKRSKYKREAWERSQEWKEKQNEDNSQEDSGQIRSGASRGKSNSSQNEKRRRDRESREQYDFRDLIIQRLMEKGYVDDRRFAEYYIENRMVKKGVSRRRLETELFKKGIEQSIINEVVMGRSDEEEIRKMIARKRQKYDDEKLISYLCRQGFPFELVRSLVRESGKD